MRNLKVMSLALALGLATFLTTAVTAENAVPNSNGAPGSGSNAPDFARAREILGKLPRKNDMQLVRELLNPEQLKQFQTISAENVSKSSAMLSELRQLQQQPPSNATDKQMTELRTKLSENRTASRAQIFALLTPEQKVKLEELKAQQPRGFHAEFDNGGNVAPRTTGNIQAPISKVPQKDVNAKP